MTEQSRRLLPDRWVSVGTALLPALPRGMVDLPKVDLPRPIFDPGYPAAYLSKGIENE